MKRKNITGQFVFALILMVILLVAAIVIFAMSAKPKTTPEDQVPDSSISSEVTLPDPTEEPVADENTRGEFKLLDSPEPTLQGKNGYFTQKLNGQSVWEFDKEFADEWCTDATAVDGLKTFLGNQVYRVPEYALSRSEPGTNEATVCVQLYGFSPNIVDPDGYVLNTAIWMREEYTGKRIYPFNTKKELDYAQECWDKGQAILAGELDEEGAIIVNGRYLNGYKFELRDGEYYIPLRQVAKLVNKDLYVDNTEGGIIIVPLQGSYAGNTVAVPYFNRAGETFTSGGVDDLGEMENGYWSDTFQAGDGPNCYVPASELSRYTGWFIYTDGHAIHIITDETDVSDHFVLAKQGNRSVEAQLQHGGSTVIKYLDPSEITFVEDEMNVSEAETGARENADAPAGEEATTP